MKNKSGKKTIKRLFEYIGRYIPAGIFVLIFAALSVAFSLYIPVLTGRAVDLLNVGPGNIDMDALRPTEREKIECGKAHFKALGNGATFLPVDDFGEFMQGI